jgi:hypothetical protein
MLGVLAVFSSDAGVERHFTLFITSVPFTQSPFTLGARHRRADAETSDVALRASGARAERTVLTRQFAYGEDEGDHDVSLARLSFDASEARFLNRGTTLFDIDRLRVRLGFDLPAKMKTTIIAEYGEDKFSLRSSDYASYNSRRVGVFLRFRPVF